jgi:prepilin-type N-terminal cleavage/methylation domain-containing protein
MQKAQLHIKKKGFSLIEILVAISIFLVFLTGIAKITSSSGKETRHSINKERAVFLAEEAIEASRNIRDADFSNLINGTYGLIVSDNQWNYSGSSDISGIFSRSLTISTINTNEKKLDAVVSWTDETSQTNSVTLSTYLTNWRKVTLQSGLTVTKTVINHGDTKVVADFAPYSIGTTTISLGTPNILSPGAYTVSETTNPNYTQTFSGDCNTGGTVTLANGDAKVCNITNEEKLAYITVNKIVSGGTLIASNFAPYRVGSTTVVLGTSTPINSGTYTVSETTNPNYIQTFSGDCNASGSITLTSGSIKTCTITNTENVPIQGTFTVTKQSNSNYRINGSNDPLLTLIRGRRYVFNINASIDPFWIKFGRSSKVTGTANAYNTGVQNNGTSVGQIIFDVPLTAPVNDLYYISQNRSAMNGNINTTP